MRRLIIILLVIYSLISLTTAQNTSLDVTTQNAPLNAISREVDEEWVIVKELEKELNELKNKLKSHNLTYKNVLNEKYEAIELLHKVNKFTALASDQQKKVSELEVHLARHESSINDTLLRQEQQLSKLEPQLMHLENQWRNQSSELERLKQLWDDMGNKSVARAADVMSLDNSIRGLDERLTQQETKIQEQELKLTTLDNDLEESDGTLKSLLAELETAMNKQGQLEGKMTSLEKQIANIRTSSSNPSSPSSLPLTADNMCGR